MDSANSALCCEAAETEATDSLANKEAHTCIALHIKHVQGGLKITETTLPPTYPVCTTDSNGMPQELSLNTFVNTVLTVAASNIIINNQSCVKWGSPNHLVPACSQINQASRAHWKPHYSELDRVICRYFEMNTITTNRQNELMLVMTKLKEAIIMQIIASGDDITQKDLHLEAFGSTENGFGSNRSDLDVSVRIGNNFSNDGEQNSHEAKRLAIKKFEAALKKSGFVRLKAISGAKVPILKFATSLGGGITEGDLSYNNTLAVHNTRLLKRYCSWTKDDKLAKLGLFVKRWAKQCDIGESLKRSLSSYAYCILLVHFLQRMQPHPLLPMLQEPNWSKCELSVGELFVQFLEYYSRFDWNTEVVQIRKRRRVARNELGWSKMMCIQDPFVLRHNLGHKVWPQMFHFIKKSFWVSHEVFSALKERDNFCRANWTNSDLPIPDEFISRYGDYLLEQCRTRTVVSRSKNEYSNMSPVASTTSASDDSLATAEEDILVEVINELSLAQQDIVSTTAGEDKRALDRKMLAHWKPHHTEELNQVICQYFENEKISPSRRNYINYVMRRLEKAIKQMLSSEDFRLELFGSSENGFGSITSDMDVSFHCGESIEEYQQYSTVEILLNIKKALKKAGFNRVTAITEARVPIVKFSIDAGSGVIEGDISCNNGFSSSHLNTRLLRRYCSWTKDNLLSKLGLFVKRWAKECGIGDASKGSLSSYTYCILVIHFLQRLKPHPLLPMLQEIGDRKWIYVNGCDIYFCDDEPKLDWTKCELSVGQLFLQFLDFYAKFKWNNQVVQIRQTVTLTKKEREWKKPMCIEDPFNLERNLGNPIKPKMLEYIKKTFVNSHQVFSNLQESENFTQTLGGSVNADNIPIPDSLISQFGDSHLAKCKIKESVEARDGAAKTSKFRLGIKWAKYLADKANEE